MIAVQFDARLPGLTKCTAQGVGVWWSLQTCISTYSGMLTNENPGHRRCCTVKRGAISARIGDCQLVALPTLAMFVSRTIKSLCLRRCDRLTVAGSASTACRASCLSVTVCCNSSQLGAVSLNPRALPAVVPAPSVAEYCRNFKPIRKRWSERDLRKVLSSACAPCLAPFPSQIAYRWLSQQLVGSVGLVYCFSNIEL